MLNSEARVCSARPCSTCPFPRPACVFSPPVGGWEGLILQMLFCFLLNLIQLRKPNLRRQEPECAKLLNCTHIKLQCIQNYTKKNYNFSRSRSCCHLSLTTNLCVSLCACVCARACVTLRHPQVSQWLAASPSTAPPSHPPPAEAAARDDATPHQVRPRARVACTTQPC